jgi:hypothetical protein
MPHNSALLIGSHSHVRPLPGRLLEDMEKLGAMEEVVAGHFRQLLSLGIQLYMVRVHNGKIR